MFTEFTMKAFISILLSVICVFSSFTAFAAIEEKKLSIELAESDTLFVTDNDVLVGEIFLVVKTEDFNQDSFDLMMYKASLIMAEENFSATLDEYKEEIDSRKTFEDKFSNVFESVCKEADRKICKVSVILARTRPFPVTEHIFNPSEETN